MIEEVLSGQADLPAIIARSNQRKRRYKTFRITPTVEIDNDLSDAFTVIEIECLDRPGLLSELTAALANLSLDIGSAHVVTFGEKANDSFYVRDLIGDKITSKSRLKKIRETLIDVMTPSLSKDKAA
jgi:[protein-PII] uridylyltransferase